MAILLGHGLFGGHERGGAQHGGGLGVARGVQGAGDAEVDQAGPVLGEDDVGGFEVAVHHPAGVHGGESFGEPRSQHRGRLQGERPVLFDGLVQGRTGDVGGGQPRPGGLGVGVHDLGGVEPADLAGGLHVGSEAAPEVRVVGQFGAHHLDGHQAPARGTAQEHLPHPAPAEPCVQPIRADLGRVAVA